MIRYCVRCVMLEVRLRVGGRLHRPGAGDGKYEVCTGAGTRPARTDPVAWAREIEARGAGEILRSSIERDGTMALRRRSTSKRLAFGSDARLSAGKHRHGTGRLWLETEEQGQHPSIWE